MVYLQNFKFIFIFEENLKIFNHTCFTKSLIAFMQAITGDSVALKFEKARCALADSLRRVEDIVPQAIGVQVTLTEIIFFLLSISFVYYM